MGWVIGRDEDLWYKAENQETGVLCGAQGMQDLLEMVEEHDYLEEFCFGDAAAPTTTGEE